jgi:hypothetical protein
MDFSLFNLDRHSNPQYIYMEFLPRDQAVAPGGTSTGEESAVDYDGEQGADPSDERAIADPEMSAKTTPIRRYVLVGVLLGLPVIIGGSLAAIGAAVWILFRQGRPPKAAEEKPETSPGDSPPDRRNWSDDMWYEWALEQGNPKALVEEAERLTERFYGACEVLEEANFNAKGMSKNPLSHLQTPSIMPDSMGNIGLDDESAVTDYAMKMIQKRFDEKYQNALRVVDQTHKDAIRARAAVGIPAPETPSHYDMGSMLKK